MRGRGWRFAGFLLSLTLTLASLALSIAMTLSSLVFEAVATGVRAMTGRETVMVARPVHYRGAQRPARQAVADASKKIRSRVAASSARSLASVGAEAMPFIGAGVAVAVTAYELREACLLMQELRDLDSAFNPDEPVDDSEICGITPQTREAVWSAITASPTAVWDQAAEKYLDLGEFPSTDILVNAALTWFGAWFAPAKVPDKPRTTP